jgi:hypothetical protein
MKMGAELDWIVRCKTNSTMRKATILEGLQSRPLAMFQWM